MKLPIVETDISAAPAHAIIVAIKNWWPYRVFLKIDHQSFQVSEGCTKAEVRLTARQLQTAMKRL